MLHLKLRFDQEIQNFKQSYEKNEQYMCPNMNLEDLCFTLPLEVKLDHQKMLTLSEHFGDEILRLC